MKAFRQKPLGCSLGFWSIGFSQRPLWPCSAKLVAEKPGKGALRVPGYSQNGVPPPQPGIPGPKNTSTTMSSLGVPYYASVVYSSVIPGVFKTEFHLGLILPVPHPLGLSLPLQALKRLHPSSPPFPARDLKLPVPVRDFWTSTGHAFSHLLPSYLSLKLTPQEQTPS